MDYGLRFIFFSSVNDKFVINNNIDCGGYWAWTADIDEYNECVF